MNERICTSCKQTKPIDAFGHDAGAPDGIARVCLACRREVSRRYASSPKGRATRAAWRADPEARARVRERAEARRLAALAPLIRKLKVGRNNARAQLRKAPTEARRRHYEGVVAEHDAELARLGVAP